MAKVLSCILLTNSSISCKKTFSRTCSPVRNGPKPFMLKLTFHFYSYVDSTRMISVGGVGNVIEGDLSEMLKNCNLAREEDESLKSASDNLFLKQAEHMLRNHNYDACINYIVKALECNPESMVSYQGPPGTLNPHCILNRTQKVKTFRVFFEFDYTCFTESVDPLGSGSPPYK